MIKNICNSREQILRAEREELLGRMSRAVRLLKEDKLDVQRELTDNDTALTNLVHTVRMTGNLVDADKLKVKLKPRVLLLGAFNVISLPGPY